MEPLLFGQCFGDDRPDLLFTHFIHRLPDPPRSPLDDTELIV
jgi:hypothetical protein